MDIISQILNKMIDYDDGDAKRIQHFIKVYQFAHIIGINERLSSDELFVLDIASILHDIGIHNCEKKYHSTDGKLQELEGPSEAKKLLEEFKLDEKIVERVCYLISHHHTYDNIKEKDYQILVEADFIVNAYEDALALTAIQNFKDKVFKTESGIKLLKNNFAGIL